MGLYAKITEDEVTYGRAIGAFLYLLAAYLMLFQFPFDTSTGLTAIARTVLGVLLVWAAAAGVLNWLRAKRSDISYESQQ